MRINTIAEHEAEGPVKIEYQRLIENFGLVPNITKIFSIHPEIFMLHNDMYQKIMVKPGRLPKPIKQIIAVLVASVSSCAYSRFWHSRFLSHLGLEDELIEQIGRDFRKAPLDDKTMAMLEYADCVARDARAVTDAHVVRLRKHGFADDEILEATSIVGYMSFVTHIAQALGVEIEKSQSDPDETT